MVYICTSLIERKLRLKTSSSLHCVGFTRHTKLSQPFIKHYRLCDKIENKAEQDRRNVLVRNTPTTGIC